MSTTASENTDKMSSIQDYVNEPLEYEEKSKAPSPKFKTKVEYFEYEKKHPFAKCEGCSEIFDRRLRGGKTRKLIRLVRFSFCCLKCSRSLPRNLKSSNFTCDICGFHNSRRKQFSNHMEKHMKLSCNACKAVLTTQKLLMGHLREHFHERNVCAVCGMIFANVFKFYKHKLRAHGKAEKPDKPAPTFSCSICPKVFKNRDTRDNHETRDHPDGRVEIYKCRKCKKGFNYERDLKEHSFVHFTGEAHHCDFPGCEKKFQKRCQLQKHQRTHALPDSSCGKCNKSFKTSFNLKRHEEKNSCKAMKKPNVQTKEMAEIAKKQFDLAKSWKSVGRSREKCYKYGSTNKKHNSDHNNSGNKGSDEVEIDSDSKIAADEDPLGEVSKDNQTSRHTSIVFVKPEPGEVDIKEEPEDVSAIKEEPEDVVAIKEIEIEAVFVKVEDTSENKVSMQPFVLLKRLENDEILRWTEMKIKTEVVSDDELPSS